MDNEEARLILDACRPAEEEAPDPVFAGALERARRDPDLAAWFEERRRFDERCRAAVASQPPPAALRDSILARHRALRPPGEGRRPIAAAWLALAAALALLAGIAFLARPAAPLTGDRFARQMIDIMRDGKISLGATGGELGNLRAWLAAAGSPSDFPLPSRIEALGGIGCQAFRIGRERVSLVCFRIDEERVVHFFVIDSARLRDAPGATPRRVRHRDGIAATWSDGGRTFVLTGEEIGWEALRALI